MRFRLAVVTAALVALAGTLAAAFFARFDPVAAADEVRAFVLERYGRELRFEGPLALSLWPMLSISVPRATLSDVGSERQAASIERANVEIAWLPLLRGRVIVEHARINGLHLNIEQRADGTRNIDNLIAPLASTPDAAPGDEPPARSPRIEIGKIELFEASVEYSDVARGIVIWLDDIELKLDELDSKMVTPMSLRARMVSAPYGVSALLRVTGTLDIDPSKRTAGLRGAELSLRGFKDGRPLDANARARRFSIALGRPGVVGRLESFAIGFKAGGPHWVIDAAHVRGATLDYDSIRLAFAANAVEANARGRLGTGAFEAALTLPEVLITNPSSRGRPIEASARWRGSQDLDLKLTLDGLSGGVQNFSAARVTLSADAVAGALESSLRVTGALKADLDAGSINLGQIGGSLSLDTGSPQPGIKLPLSGSLHTEASAQTIDTELETRLESSLMRLRARYDPSRIDGRLALSLNADQLDLDRLDTLLSPVTAALSAPPRRPESSSPQTARPGERAADPGRASLPADPVAARSAHAAQAAGIVAPHTPEAIIKRAAGGSWTADLQVGQLKANWLRAAAVRLSAQSLETGIRLPSLTLSMHGGSVSGQADFDSASEQFTLTTRGRGIDSAALLETLGHPRRLEGLTDWQLTLSGLLNAQPLADTLRGELSLSIAEGRLHGVDFAGAARETARKIRASRDRRTAPPEESDSPLRAAPVTTEFDRLAARFVFRNGQARSQDLLLETPLLKAAGTGSIDLREQAVEAYLRVTLRNPGSDPLLAALNRLSLPVQLQGPLAQPQWRIDTSTLLPPRSRR